MLLPHITPCLDLLAQKTGFDISCNMLSKKTLCMKPFFLENKKNIFKMTSAFPLSYSVSINAG